MMEFKTKLHPYPEYQSHTQLVNLNRIEYFLWVEIPQSIACRSSLFLVEEITQGLKIPFNQCPKSIERDGMKPWLKIATSELNKSEGFHLYKFSFIDIETDDILVLYMPYVIQNDNPDKPYVYMKDSKPVEVETAFLNMDDGSRYERRQ